MYKLSVPIMSATVNDSNREKYAKQCKEAGARRVFLCADSADSLLKPVPAHFEKNVRYFKSQGFEVGIWTDTLGHGLVLKHVEKAITPSDFSHIVDITGATQHAFCPLDDAFADQLAAYVAALASTGADIVMFDDDFRMSQRGEEIGCACEKHLALIGEKLGEEVTLDTLRPYIFSGKPNKYRNAWLEAQNEGLVALAKRIRAKVDESQPQVKLCFCTAYSPWNVDGMDVAQITKILAGDHAPLLRLTGAPYWAIKYRRFPLITVFEIARMLASFCSEFNFELMCEGDVYPRPRYTCPAAYLELYDAAMRADGGYNGILKYMFDYVAGPELETGYLKQHAQNKELFEKISAFFANGANVGVNVVCRPHTLKAADLDLSRLTPHSPRPSDGTMLSSCGIPTVYGKDGICNSVFGENARFYDLDKLKEGTVLDAVSAIILTERGVDVGLVRRGQLAAKEISYLSTNDPEYKSFITDGDVRVLDAVINEKAEPLLYSTLGGSKETVAYSYENANGERFLVFLFEGDSVYSRTRICDSGIFRCFPMQDVLVKTLPWVARQPIPACSVGNPELYLLCRKEADSMSVALFNCFADSLCEPVVILDGNYNTIECFGCEARLEGNKVTLTSRMHGFTCAIFKVTKQ